MKQIKIENVGPIKEVDINLNKVNVFMGPQSSGKSTIAKIISCCSWIEKERITSLGSTTFGISDFLQRLEIFHNMKGYFKHNSIIEYTNGKFILNYNARKDFFQISGIDCLTNFVRTKIAYIPSERFIISLPEIMKVDFPNNNIRNFIFDWFTARKYYQENSIDILDLGIRYTYNEKTNQDNLILGNGQNILLTSASSGMQTVTPLIVLLNYLTEWIYKNKEDLSFEKMQRNENISNYISQQKGITKENIHLIDRIISNQFTQLILEEPEQNLFPSTQRDLLYFLIKSIQKEQKEHCLTLTTHSPYILYALNNCLMASLAAENPTHTEELFKLPSFSSKISPSLVSIWEIEDGKLRSIQDEDGIISENYFDQKMTELTDEYYSLLNHLDDEGED